VAGADIEVKGWPELASDGDEGQWIATSPPNVILRFTVG